MEYVIRKTKNIVGLANEYTIRGDLYQAGLKIGEITALCDFLQMMGIPADYDYYDYTNGGVIIQKIIVNDEEIFCMENEEK